MNIKENEWTTKIYYWKKSTKPIILYIIIFVILIIIWYSIKWEASEEIILITILTLPLLILFIIDYYKWKNAKIELTDTELNIINEYGIKTKIQYKDILLIYNIIYKSTNITYNTQILQIFNKSGHLATEINNIYMKDINNFLQELYKKNIIICELQIKDSKTNDINDKKAIYRILPPITIWYMPVIHEKYAITRDIKKTYRWVPENETEKFEKKHNLINFTIKEKKEIH